MIEEIQNLLKDPVQNAAEAISEIGEAAEYGTFTDRQDALEALNGFLAAQSAALEKTNPDIYEQYQKLWVRLAFRTLLMLDSNDQDTLLKTRLLEAVEEGFNPDNVVQDFFNFYDSDEFVQDRFRGFAKSVEQNSEQFGAAPVLVEGKKMMPSLKYWILDYAKTPTKSARRGSIDRLNYINQSQNARGLTQVYKQQLLKILKFYDDLIYAERPPEKPVQIQSEPDTNRQSIDIDRKLEELRQRVI